MRITRLLPALCAIGFANLYAGTAVATDISTKGLQIKDNAVTTKRQILIKSKDANVHFSDAVAPDTNGMTLHLYSTTDDYCTVLPSGAGWDSTSTKWKFKDRNTKNSAQIKDGFLMVKIKSSITYSLMDNNVQGTVNALVKFGTGTSFCMRCTGNKKDQADKFQAADCIAAACDAEPSACPPPPHMGTVLKGALPATNGRFNYNLTTGLAGANSACTSNFAGTQACTYAQLQAAESAGDLVDLKDTTNTAVTSFWAIDPNAPVLAQCNDSLGSGLNWEYGTAHTTSRGQKVPLTNGTGTLGSLQTGVQCNTSGASTVGCCQ